MWQQDEREQRTGIEALWEQKVQAALWRMDAAASAMVAREAGRKKPEEITALSRQNHKPWGRGPAGPARAAWLKTTRAGLQARVPRVAAWPDAPKMKGASVPAAVAPVAAARALLHPPSLIAENKSNARYFSKSLAHEKRRRLGRQRQ